MSNRQVLPPWGKADPGPHQGGDKMLFQHKQLLATHLGGRVMVAALRVECTRLPRGGSAPSSRHTCSGRWLQFQAFLIGGIQDLVLAFPLRFSFLPEKHNPCLCSGKRVCVRLRSPPTGDSQMACGARVQGCCLREELLLPTSQLGQAATVTCYSSIPHQLGKR